MLAKTPTCRILIALAVALTSLATRAAAQQVAPGKLNGPTAAVPGVAPESYWTVDKIHSRIGFSVAHFTITQVTGYFQDFDAKITCLCPADDFTGGAVDFAAKTSSVFTDNSQRDGHLRSDAFFGADRYPEMSFTGTLIKADGKSQLRGNMTIRDVTKPVSFDVIYGGRIKDKNLGIEKAGFKITGKVNRLDYGLKWNETFEGGCAIVGQEVMIDINVEIDRKNLDSRPQ